MSNPVSRNPNATTAGGTTGIGVVVVWILGHFGVAVSAELGAAIAGLITVAALAFARYGLLGVWSRFLRGTGSST